ncbi:uncharacterized protein [Oryza sativa Japonica Group]|uniref:Os05g0304100 protein n=2 Tax=Oryza sativa subsp. japonica TaxID=39947 RepID=A0A0P0WKE2_ORYSJ|nr:uncharacterized protein LOC4338355 [Oryza sativa Japonica Group]KAB8098819.1 hypothetical protein EE612_028483 [Oryza sativa]BAS93250.1 Os05g0304100 [Oryza sativa Japonica Group]
MSSSRGPPSPPSHPNPIDPFAAAAAAAAEAEGEAAPPPRNPIIPRDPPSPEMEATAEALTREEVLRRRRRRAKRLVDVYRRLYWTLGEELRARHRQYVWELGRSPLEAEQPPPPPPTSAAPGPGGDLVVVRPVSATVPRRKKCGFAGCKVRTMAMARFCHSHILSDPNQVLYKGCAYISKSGPQVQITCGRPILKASVPSLCNSHFQKCQKLITQGYKKFGVNPSPTGKVSPNFSLLVAECVRQIQAKRRESPS